MSAHTPECTTHCPPGITKCRGRASGAGPTLVGTAEFGRRFGFGLRSISRWVAGGKLVPDQITPDGRMWWDLVRLNCQFTPKVVLDYHAATSDEERAEVCAGYLRDKAEKARARRASP